MKKIKIALLGMSVLIAAQSFAQKDTKKSDASAVAFGIKAGFNIANVTVKSSGLTVTPSSLFGATGGFFANIPVGTGGFGIQPELLYSMMGYKISSSITGGNVDGTANLNYLSIPVLAKYNINKPGFGVYAGPQLGILMSAKAKSGSVSEDIKDQVKSTDMSAVVGLEYGLEMGLNFSTRYQIGLSNIDKDPASGTSTKNNAFTFTIGYQFH